MNGFPKKLKRKRRHKRTKDLRHVDLGCVGFPSHRRLMHEHLPFKKNRSEDTWIINWTAWIWIDFTPTTGIQMVSFTPIGDFEHFSCHFYGLGWQQARPRKLQNFLPKNRGSFEASSWTSSSGPCFPIHIISQEWWREMSLQLKMRDRFEIMKAFSYWVMRRYINHLKSRIPLLGLSKPRRKKQIRIDSLLVYEAIFLEVLWKWMLVRTLHLIRWRYQWFWWWGRFVCCVGWLSSHLKIDHFAFQLPSNCHGHKTCWGIIPHGSSSIHQVCDLPPCSQSCVVVLGVLSL